MSIVEPQTLTPEEAALVSYVPVNRWAVAAVVLAALSWLAFVMQVFWVVPILAACVSIRALRSIVGAERKTLGRKAAATALVVSLFVLGYAPARAASVYLLATGQARVHAQTWVDLVRNGKLQEAHQLTLRYADRVEPGYDLKNLYMPSNSPAKQASQMMMIELPDPHRDLDRFFRTRPVADIVQAGPRAKMEFDRVAHCIPDFAMNRTKVHLRYRLIIEENGRVTSKKIRIVLERDISARTGKSHWRIDSVDDPVAMGLES